VYPKLQIWYCCFFKQIPSNKIQKFYDTATYSFNTEQEALAHLRKNFFVYLYIPDPPEDKSDDETEASNSDSDDEPYFYFKKISDICLKIHPQVRNARLAYLVFCNHHFAYKLEWYINSRIPCYEFSLQEKKIKSQEVINALENPEPKKTR